MPMQTPSRFAVVLVAVAGLVFFGSGSALADTPATWADPEPTSWLHNLVLFGGSTLGLIVVITLFGLLTARNNYTPPPPSTDVEVHPDH
jgi:hypothetical protein